MARRTGRTVAVAALAALLLASCGNSTSDEGGSGSSASRPPGTAGGGGEATRDEFVSIEGVPGVTDEEIGYVVVGTKTGNPLGICILDCYVDGIEAYFAYRNSQGGIYGRDLVITEVLDDELAQNQARAQQIVADDSAFGTFQATLLASGWGDLDQAGIPAYVWGINATESMNRPSNFPSLAIRCNDCLRPAVPYMAKSVGATTVASVGYGISENSKSCTKSVADSVEHYQGESGVSLGYTNDTLEYGLPNGIGPVVTAMKEAGVDFVSTCIDLNGMKTLAQELKRQGMEDVVLYHPNSYDTTFIGESDGLFDGDIVNVQFRPFEASAEGNAMADYMEWMEEQGNETSELSMVGWINASMAFDALLAAGPEFDRQAVIDALNSVTDYTAGGLVVPIDWTRAHTPYTRDEQDAEAQECSAFVRVEDSAFVTYSTPEEPWICWAPGAPPGFEATPTNFD